MKILKTATIIILIFIALGAVLYFIPLESLFSRLPVLKNMYNNTSITVNSRNGKAVVKINGKDYGETPVSASNLPQGAYTIELVRISDSSDFYKPREVQIELVRNTEAIVDMEIGPDDVTSGYVLYYTTSPIKSSNSGYITLSSIPDGSNVYLNEEFFLKSPVSAYKLDGGNYEVKIEKVGYEELKFPIIIRSGYNLNISSYLYPIPLNINGQ